MIKISQELQKKYQADSVNKELIISFGNSIKASEINFYFGSLNNSSYQFSNIALAMGETRYLYANITGNWTTSFTDFIANKYFSLEEYLCFSADFSITNVTAGKTNNFGLVVEAEKINGGDAIFSSNFSVSQVEDAAVGTRIHIIFPTKDIKNIERIGFTNLSAESLQCTINLSQYQVEVGKMSDLPTGFKQSPVYLGENIEDAVKVDKTLPDDIGNKDLLSESFSLTEALCSQKNIKFGLCESSYVEFTLANRTEKFLNKKMSLFLNIKKEVTGEWNLCDGTINSYQLDSDNLRWPGWVVAPSLVSGQVLALSFEYSVHNASEASEVGLYIKFGDSIYFNEMIPSLETGYITRLLPVENNQGANYEVRVAQTNSASHPVTLSKLMLTLDTFREWNISENDYQKSTDGDRIPLGVFTIGNVKKNSNMKTKTITAYDDLTKLNQNAEDWYTQYMFLINTEDAARNGAEFARQIFSTYYNLAYKLGIEEGKEEKKLLSSFTYSQVRSSYLTEKYLKINKDPAAGISYIKYAKFTFANPNTSKLFQVRGTNIDNYTDQFMFSSILSSYFDAFDSQGRGVLSKASVLVEEIRLGKYTNRFLCDLNDYFMLSPSTTSINIYIPFYTCGAEGIPFNAILEDVSFFEVDRSIELKNGSLRLMYYNWGTKEIFQSPSSLTARDVFRSLIEVCGAFYKLDRLGKPQFKYCTKSAVYPSNSLYPKDALYPRGNDGMFTRHNYMSYWYEDYKVQDFGKIQIKKEQSDNANPVAGWEYIGDVNKKNIYIIEDNIFYCSRDMEYEYDAMQEVSEMLQNMFSAISDLGYVPCDITAKGLPYLETGDRITLLTEDSATETFIFSRTLTGISILKDNYESKGDECNEEISDYGYKEWKEGV